MYNCGNRFRPTDIYDYDNLEDTKYNTQSAGADLINNIERNLDDCTICAACSLGSLNNNTGPLDPGMQNYDPIQVQELPLGSTLQTITSQSSQNNSYLDFKQDQNDAYASDHHMHIAQAMRPSCSNEGSNYQEVSSQASLNIPNLYEQEINYAHVSLNIKHTKYNRYNGGPNSTNNIEMNLAACSLGWSNNDMAHWNENNQDQYITQGEALQSGSTLQTITNYANQNNSYVDFKQDQSDAYSSEYHMHTYIATRPSSGNGLSNHQEVSSQVSPNISSLYEQQKNYASVSLTNKYFNGNQSNNSCTSRECNQSLCNNKSLERNTQTQTRSQSFICTVCGKNLRSKHYISAHMRIHTREQPYKCSACGKSFTFNSSLYQHMRIHTREQPYTCTWCNKHFRFHSNFSKHMLLHTKSKLYICTLCGRRFNSSSYLKAHMRTYSREQLYICTVCDRRFAFESSLNAHMYTHTPEQPYRCTLCDKYFSLHSTLSRHMLLHTRAQSSICTVCGKNLSSKNYMSTHMRIHTREQPYTCTICSKKFSFHGSLHKHMLTHKTTQPYTCKPSDEIFRSNRPSQVNVWKC